MLTDHHNALSDYHLNGANKLTPTNFQRSRLEVKLARGGLDMPRSFKMNFKDRVKGLKLHKELHSHTVTISALSSRIYHEITGRQSWTWLRDCSRFLKLFTRKLLPHLQKPTFIAFPGFPGSCWGHVIEFYQEWEQKQCVPFLSQGLSLSSRSTLSVLFPPNW